MRTHPGAWLRAALVLASLIGVLVPAVAADAPRRLWQIGEFSQVQRVPREAGSEPNQHPRVLPPEQLRPLLASLRVVIKGKSQPLFVPDEIGDLIEPLSQALAAAEPGDDLLLVSTTRRGDNLLAPATGLTARLFVQSEQLHVIVHDARLDFMGAWIGARIQPKFVYGTRSRASDVALQSATGQARRSDWLALPLAAAAVAPSAAPTAPAAPARDNGFYQEQEQRLRGLKRLLEQGLISEAEYQQKRREILQTL